MNCPLLGVSASAFSVAMMLGVARRLAGSGSGWGRHAALRSLASSAWTSEWTAATEDLQVSLMSNCNASRGMSLPATLELSKLLQHTPHEYDLQSRKASRTSTGAHVCACLRGKRVSIDDCFDSSTTLAHKAGILFGCIETFLVGPHARYYDVRHAVTLTAFCTSTSAERRLL